LMVQLTNTRATIDSDAFFFAFAMMFPLL